MPAHPKPPSSARLTAARRRREATAHRVVYQEVDRRDDRRCRVCAVRPLAIQRHHVVYRSRGGRTTPSNLVSLCPACHAEVHAKTLRLEGHTEARNRCGMLCGVRIERRTATGWRLVGWR